MPSTDESRNPSTFAFANIATHGPPRVPRVSPSAPLPTRVHAQPLRARSTRLPSYSLELAGHVPLIDFCNGEDPRAHQRTVTAQPFGLCRQLDDELPRCRTEPTPAGDPEPLAGTCQPGCLRPGVAVSFRIDLSTPTQRPLATVDLPQPDRPGHPLSRADVRRHLEHLAPNDRAVVRSPLRLSARTPKSPCGELCSPDAPRLRATSLLGPPSTPPRER
jgi:hypothetical protein